MDEGATRVMTRLARMPSLGAHNRQTICSLVGDVTDSVPGTLSRFHMFDERRHPHTTLPNKIFPVPPRELFRYKNYDENVQPGVTRIQDEICDLRKCITPSETTYALTDHDLHCASACLISESNALRMMMPRQSHRAVLLR